MKERAPWPPRRSRAKERWRPRALLYDFEVEVPTRTGVGGGGRDRSERGLGTLVTSAPKFLGNRNG